MSYVTNLLLSVGFGDGERIGDVNQYFEPRIRGLVGLHDPALPNAWYGGTKYLEANVYVGALNHLDLQAFLQHLRTVKWREPGQVQLIIKDQEDFAFRIVVVFPDAFANLEAELVDGFKEPPFPPPCLSALYLGGVPRPPSAVPRQNAASA